MRTKVGAATAVPEPASARSGGELLRLSLRLVVGLLIACSIVLFVGYFAHRPAEALARGFVHRFGIGGMALGTLLADGLHFPIPPQFYMLLAVASGTPMLSAFPAIAGASVMAGYFGYHVAEWASHVAWIDERSARYRELLVIAFGRHGYRAALLASLLPIPFSVLCYLVGLNRMPRTFLALLCAYRVPKLVAFYALIHFGWSWW